MSQLSVERVIGALATDEGLRRRFRRNPGGLMSELAARGLELNPGELRSLAALDPDAVSRFAEAIDPRLQKTDLEGGCP